MQAIKQSGFPANKVLGAGIIDGRVFGRRLFARSCHMEELTKYVAPERLIVQSSCACSGDGGAKRNCTRIERALAFADEAE